MIDWASLPGNMVIITKFRSPCVCDIINKNLLSKRWFYYLRSRFVAHLRCKVTMLSPPFPNFFGQCPRLSVKGPVQSGKCPFQLLKKAVTLHRATEIIIFVPQIPYNIWQIKTGIRHNIRGSCFSFFTTCSHEHSKVSFQVPEKVSRAQALPKQPCPCGTGNSPKSNFPSDACGAEDDKQSCCENINPQRQYGKFI